MSQDDSIAYRYGWLRGTLKGLDRELHKPEPDLDYMRQIIQQTWDEMALWARLDGKQTAPNSEESGAGSGREQPEDTPSDESCQDESWRARAVKSTRNPDDCPIGACPLCGDSEVTI